MLKEGFFMEILIVIFPYGPCDGIVLVLAEELTEARNLSK